VLIIMQTQHFTHPHQHTNPQVKMKSTMAFLAMAVSSQALVSREASWYADAVTPSCHHVSSDLFPLAALASRHTVAPAASLAHSAMASSESADKSLQHTSALTATEGSSTNKAGAVSDLPGPLLMSIADYCVSHQGIVTPPTGQIQVGPKDIYLQAID